MNAIICDNCKKPKPHLEVKPYEISGVVRWWCLACSFPIINKRRVGRPIPLREAVTEYSKWIAVIYGALVRQHITPFEAFEMVKQLKAGLTNWIGEELLNHYL